MWRKYSSEHVVTPHCFLRCELRLTALIVSTYTNAFSMRVSRLCGALFHPFYLQGMVSKLDNTSFTTQCDSDIL